MISQTIQDLQYFFDNKIEIHVSCVGGIFYNGFVIAIHEHYFELNDRKLGRVPVFFVQLKGIEKCREEYK